MDATHETLATRAIEHYQLLNTPSSSHTAPNRLLIAVSGSPGSGKTTSTTAIAANINIRFPQIPPLALVISTDGFHYSRSYLDKLPNAAEAHARRGAPYTFDARGIIALITRCRGLPSSSSDSDEDASMSIYAPSFDHALKDPVENGVVIERATGILIFEGNYLLIGEKPWDVISGLVDEKWFVKVDEDIARTRLARRHVEAGIEDSMEKALRRVEGNDLLNGRWVVEKSDGRADLVIESFEE